MSLQVLDLSETIILKINVRIGQSRLFVQVEIPGPESSRTILRPTVIIEVSAVVTSDQREIDQKCVGLQTEPVGRVSSDEVSPEFNSFKRTVVRGFELRQTSSHL